MVANIKDMTGERFGLLTVIGMHPHRNRFKQVMWDCRCDCGNMIAYSGCLLRINNIVHCGKCPYRILGYAKGSIRQAWLEVLQDLHKVYIDPKWIESIINFYKDVGDRPSGDHALERINPKGPYVKNNMRWVDGLAHRRQPRYLFMGESVSCAELARKFGITRQAMSQGLKSGWTMAQLEQRYRKQQAEASNK